MQLSTSIRPRRIERVAPTCVHNLCTAAKNTRPKETDRLNTAAECRAAEVPTAPWPGSAQCKPGRKVTPVARCEAMFEIELSPRTAAPTTSQHRRGQVLDHERGAATSAGEPLFVLPPSLPSNGGLSRKDNSTTNERKSVAMVGLHSCSASTEQRD